MPLRLIEAAVAAASADVAGGLDDRLQGLLRLELAAFCSMLARERGTDVLTVLGQLLVAGCIAEGFVLQSPDVLLN